LQVADFTVSAYYGFLVLVSTKPSPFFEWKAIFYPFQTRAWLAIIASTLLTVLAYRFFLNSAVKEKDKHSKESRIKELNSLNKKQKRRRN